MRRGSNRSSVCVVAAALSSVFGCGRVNDSPRAFEGGEAPDAVAPASPSAASAASAASAPTAEPLADASAARACVGSGSFELAAILFDPACRIANDDPRAKAVAEKGPDKTAPLRFVAGPANLRVTTGATFELDLTVTNTHTSTTEIVLVVRPDEWGAIAVRDPRDRDAWLSLARVSPSSIDGGDRSARWVAFRMNGRASGHTRLAARAVRRSVEHLAPGPAGAPAPHANVERPLEPGTYDVRIVDPLLATELVSRVKLTVEPRDGAGVRGLTADPAAR